VESSNDSITSLTPEDIGKSAGEVYEVLNNQGKATAKKLKNHVNDTMDSETVNQALGWLAKEGKVEIEVKKNGETKYRLNS